MRREPSWVLRIAVAATGLGLGILIGNSLVHGTELPIPKKHRGIVINLIMHRERGPAPKFVAPAAPLDRPAGTP